MVAALPGMQHVYTGIPSSRDTRVTATVTLAGAPITEKAAGLLRRNGRYLVLFGVRLDGDDAGAETLLAGLIDSFTAAWVNNRLLKDGGGNATCLSSTLDFQMADRPEYVLDAALEFRFYPVQVVVVQELAYNNAGE